MEFKKLDAETVEVTTKTEIPIEHLFRMFGDIDSFDKVSDTSIEITQKVLVSKEQLLLKKEQTEKKLADINEQLALLK